MTSRHQDRVFSANRVASAMRALLRHSCAQSARGWHLMQLVWLLTMLGGGISPGGALHADERLDFFERRIRPALVEHCYECHSNARGKSEGGLLLDSQPAVQRGGESGTPIVPGKPEDSLLIEAIRYESLEMPPGKRLDDTIIRDFETWIRSGASDPRAAETKPGEAAMAAVEAARRFWALQPLSHGPVPALGSDWVRSPIDGFVLQQLRQHGLEPAAEAGPATLLRRVTFDLTGLPPNVQEFEAFMADTRSDAYERVVDRLLASPQYGERWGRHWLDLARYATTNGADENHQYPVAWRYRDYIVSAYNEDKPFDRMVLEQLAGDLLPAETEAERRQNLTATGFLVLGPKMLAEQDKEKLVADIVDEQLDTVGKVFLGLTLGCARCHDHKFDPITARDYYSLAGIFHSTRTMEHLDHVSQWNERELPDSDVAERLTEHRQTLARAETQVARLADDLRDVEFNRQLQALGLLMAEEFHETAAPWVPSDTLYVEALAPEATQPLTTFLSGDSGVLRIWKRLSSLSDEHFSRAAERLWRETGNALKDLEAEDESALFETRLVAQPVPQVGADLIRSYLATLGECRELLLEAEADVSIWKTLFAADATFDLKRLPADYLSQADRTRLERARQRVDALSKSIPQLPKAMAADDAAVKLVALHVRGDHLQQSGPPLPRSVPRVLQDFGSNPVFPESGSGRLELAQWLTHPDHPLTARVMVNRIWQGHFGQGIVRSPSNSGIRGEEPTHPELLDWLAAEFMRGDWSLKQMHRMILLSSTYRMSHAPSLRAKSIDPQNRLLSYFPRRRMELEAIRDALLAISGRLDLTLGGEVKAVNNSKYDDSGRTMQVFDSPRRTIYLPINRAALDPIFSTFDYVDPAVSLEQRPATIVPHQTLFLMNHPLVMDAGRRLARRVLQHSTDREERITFAHVAALSRIPVEAEYEVATDFLATHLELTGNAGDASTALSTWTKYCRSLLLTSEFMYVD